MQALHHVFRWVLSVVGFIMIQSGDGGGMVESLVEGARHFLTMNSAKEVDRCTRTDSPDFGAHVMLRTQFCSVLSLRLFAILFFHK